MKTRWGHWLLLCGLAGITVMAEAKDSINIRTETEKDNALFFKFTINQEGN